MTEKKPGFYVASGGETDMAGRNPVSSLVSRNVGWANLFSDTHAEIMGFFAHQ